MKPPKSLQCLRSSLPTVLTIRQWLLLAWACYALLPGVSLGIVYGLLWLVTRLDPSKNGLATALVIVAALLVQIGVPVAVAVFVGRAVLRPLSALSRASRQVAAGNLDFDLPATNVREVAEVSAAFVTMGDGLRAAITRQAQLEAERRFFVGAIAHDLRTPLFALRGYLQGLARGIATTPERTAYYIAVCQEKADELERLVADLFTFTQVEHLEQVARRAPLELGEVLVAAIAGLRPLAEAKGVTLTLDPSSEPCRLEGDAHLVMRAATNLLDNALRHTPAGGTIGVRWRAAGERCVFSVADTGPGIDPRDLPHLFEPLYRGEASRSRDTGGAGLGLAIARRILLAHGGDLVAANLPSGGAEFSGSLFRPLPATVEAS